MIGWRKGSEMPKTMTQGKGKGTKGGDGKAKRTLAQSAPAKKSGKGTRQPKAALTGNPMSNVVTKAKARKA